MRMLEKSVNKSLTASVPLKIYDKRYTKKEQLHFLASLFKLKFYTLKPAEIELTLLSHTVDDVCFNSTWDMSWLLVMRDWIYQMDIQTHGKTWGNKQQYPKHNEKIEAEQDELHKKTEDDRRCSRLVIIS